MFKGKVQRDFWPPFPILPGPLTNGLNYFRFWLRFRRVIRIFLGIILCRVNLSAVSYCAESISPQYHTAGSQYPRSIILRGVYNEPGHFLKLLHRPLTGQCHKNKCGFLFYQKQLYFAFLQKNSRINFC